MTTYYSATAALDRNKLATVKRNDGAIAKHIARAAEQRRREREKQKRNQEVFCQRVEHVGKLVGHGVKAAQDVAMKAHAEVCRRMQK